MSSILFRIDSNRPPYEVRFTKNPLSTSARHEPAANLDEIVVKMVVTFAPNVVRTPKTTSATNMMINAYSTNPCPSSFRNIWRKLWSIHLPFVVFRQPIKGQG